MDTRTLDQFLNHAVVDMWRRNPRGSIVVRRPRTIQNGGGVSVSTTIEYGIDKKHEEAHQDSMADVPTPHVKIWQPALRAYGLGVLIKDGAIDAGLAATHFPEDVAAEIINAKGTLTSALELRRKYGSISTRDVFNFCERKGISEFDVLQRIKEYYSPKKPTSS